MLLFNFYIFTKSGESVVNSHQNDIFVQIVVGTENVALSRETIETTGMKKYNDRLFYPVFKIWQLKYVTFLNCVHSIIYFF